MKFSLVVVSLLLLACTEADPVPGQEGGPCRVSLEPCDAPLVCGSGGCQKAADAEEAAVAVEWSFPRSQGRPEVQADGMDALVIQAILTDRSTGELMPQNFGFRMWVEPPEAGTLTVLRDFNPIDPDGRWNLLDGEGRALATFTSCNKADPGCVRYASIRLAVEPRPLQPVDQVLVENLGARQPGGGAGGAGGGGAGGAGGEGGGSEELPPLGPCPADRVKAQAGGMTQEYEVKDVQIREASTRRVNMAMANNEILALISLVVDTNGLGEDLSVGPYPEVGMGVSLEMNASVQGTSLCSGFRPTRLSVERYEVADGTLRALSVQVGGFCNGEGYPISACAHWEAP